ncbi:hypothetical protein SERLADRAFT_404449 [Serpula lacrymans var. lacrymans S7.9]|uniref:Uncharacterized protein n=1 Tax=Serpula lacrymans var. lacrymans (strain S7.9) TaxID=578457 RepID=F8ND55_SERL9|nr:uncharacterized protein SERLADRAFT_404449 [Serpula lacrymans var. lacrymans S7.9]EGO30139.1 hypothetical protein SERLADRAFT_404449 [Serpula lacrymans var. lacrymans S7.9]
MDQCSSITLTLVMNMEEDQTCFNKWILMKIVLQDRRIQHFWPFSSREEWELAEFLNENLNQTQLDAFLKLKWTCKQTLLFSSAHQLSSFMDFLPSGPKWKMQTLVVVGYLTMAPIRLFFRDGLEVANSIFSNPIFANQALEEHCVYSEFMTADYAWELQDQYPVGATVMGIIAGSDKTAATRRTAGMQMHPIFLSLANINSEVHMKATSHAWMCTAFMPIVTFNNVHPEFHAVLDAQLWHRCMDMVISVWQNVGRLCQTLMVS